MRSAGVLLVRDAEVAGRRVDVVVAGGLIERIVPARTVTAAVLGPGATVIHAHGGALIPGLHDHHLHLLAMAAAEASVPAGPPDVSGAQQLGEALRAADRRLEPGRWIRAVGYYDSVAGEIDRTWLDALGIDRPIRVQHRTGALWILNSAALAAIGGVEGAPDGVEIGPDGRPTGRFYRADVWLRERLPRQAPDLASIGRRLAGFGVTGVTDLTPTSDPDEVALIADAVRSGAIPQRVTVTGAATLPAGASPELPRGPVKVVIDDHELPGLDWLAEQFSAARATGRAVAVHCVTREALVLAVATWREIGAVSGDRIEHGALIPHEMFGELAALELMVVTQPSFVHERGDDYLVDVDAADRPDLWRCSSLIDAGIPVAFGSDAPYGDADPWAAIDAAVHRRTRSGAVLGPHEAIGAAAALDRLLGSAGEPTTPRRVEAGAVADLCLLDRPLADQLAAPDGRAVAATIVGGMTTYVAAGTSGTTG